jgi:hypothetical protein
MQETISDLRSVGASWSRIGDYSGLSRSQLHRERSNGFVDPVLPVNSQSDPYIRGRFMEELTRFVSMNKTAGYRLATGHILSKLGYKVTRSYMLESMRAIDAAGVNRRQLRKIQRTRYNGIAPGHVTHIDTHHKLGKYGFITFGAIDGYSHEILSLECLSNNRSFTLLESYLDSPGFQSRGIPNLIRGDRGLENVAIATFINTLRGENHFIAGRSVHNVRIERLWRDMHRVVTKRYQSIFRTLEEEYAVNFDIPENVWIIQTLFLPSINEQLSIFKDSWNNHTMKMQQEKGRFSPSAINLLMHQNSRYLPYAENQANIVRVKTELNQIYAPDERQTANSKQPFTNPAQLNAFITTVEKIDCTDNIQVIIQKCTAAFTLVKQVSVFHRYPDILSNLPNLYL